MGVFSNIPQFFRSAFRRFSFHPSSRLLVILALSIFVVGVFSLVQFLNRRSASASSDWYNDDWTYRRAISFGNTGSSETDRKVKVDIDTATLISAGKMQADCGDGRFTSLNGQVLDYYLDSAGGACNTSSTDFWVRIPIIYSGETAFYIYYGNTSIANGTMASQLLQSTFVPTSGLTVGDEESGPGPVAYWKFDEGQGSTANDSTGSNDGTLGSGSSAPTWVSDNQCISGKCLRFDGANDYVIYDGDGEFKFQGQDFTVSVWVKTNDLGSNYDGIISTDSGGDSAWKIKRDTNQDYFRFRYSTLDLPYDQVKVGEWHQYAAVKSGTNVYLYQNGTLVNSGTAPATYTGGSNDLVIGAYRVNDAISSNHMFTGFIDEPKIYNYARTAEQIKTDFVKGAGAHGSSAVLGRADLSFLSDGLVGYWKMDEVGVSGANWTAIDSSGNNNNGTGAGNASVGTTAPGKFGNGGFFDGTGDYVSIGSAIAPSTEITLSAWIKGTAFGSINHIISKRVTNNNWQFFVEASKIRFTVYNAANTVICDIGSGNTLSTSTWYFVTATFDGRNCRLYENGQQAYETAGSGAIGTNGTTVTIGTTNGTANYWSGGLDEVRIYNRALDPSEVQTLYEYSPGPVGWWKMDEGSGSTAIDSSGNGNTGALGVGDSAPIWSQGKFGKALRFDGSNDYVDAGSSTPLNITSALTISAWVKYTSTSSEYARIVSNGQNGTSYGYELYRRSNSGEIAFGDSAGFVYTTDTFNDGNWHHVIGIHDGSNAFSGLFIYVDGVLRATTTAGTFDGFSSTTQNFAIGAGYDDGVLKNGAYLFKGLIDDVKIYNYARTQEQIIEDMNAGHPAVGGPVGSAVLDLSFDEGYGTTAYDASPHDNDGTLGAGTSAPTWTNDGKFGKALSFDGVNDYVDAGSSIPTTDTTGSISVWVKFNTVTTNAKAIFGWGSTNVTDSFVHYLRLTSSTDGTPSIGNAYIQARIRDNAATANNTIIGSTVISAGNWYHVVFTADGSTYSMYINGQKQNLTAYLGVNNGKWIGALTKPTGTTKTSVGAQFYQNAYLNYSNAIIDEVKVYPFALTAEQVKQEYAGGQSLVFGSSSTGVGGTAPSNAASREYCVPGDMATCNPPVGEWKFDKVSGTTTYDTSTNGNNGTLMNGPVQVQGKVGQALRFDGVDDYVDIYSSNFANLFNGNEGTISLWAKVGNSNIWGSEGLGKRIIQLQVDANNYIYIRKSTSDNALDFVRAGNGTQDSRTPVNLTTTGWMHLSFTWSTSADRLIVYIDGIRVGEETTLGSWSGALASTTTKIGALNPSTLHWNGFIDQVRIYDYARTPAQIAWEYNRGVPVAWYKFDECQGTTVSDWGPNSNGGFNGNNGTINIGPSGTQTTAGTCKTSGAWYNGRNGKRNASLNFDGSDDYVNIEYSYPNSRFSISGWIKRTGPIAYTFSFAGLFGLRNATEMQRGFALSPGDVIMFRDYQGSTTVNTTGVTADLNTWKHVVATYEGTTLKLYVDGQLRNTIVITLANNVVTDLQIGAINWGTVPNRSFNGQIDDVKIFNYALTPEQVKLDYNSGAVRFE